MNENLTYICALQDEIRHLEYAVEQLKQMNGFRYIKPSEGMKFDFSPAPSIVLPLMSSSELKYYQETESLSIRAEIYDIKKDKKLRFENYFSKPNSEDGTMKGFNRSMSRIYADIEIFKKEIFHKAADSLPNCVINTLEEK